MADKIWPIVRILGGHLGNLLVLSARATYVTGLPTAAQEKGNTQALAPIQQSPQRPRTPKRTNDIHTYNVKHTTYMYVYRAHVSRRALILYIVRLSVKGGHRPSEHIILGFVKFGILLRVVKVGPLVVTPILYFQLLSMPVFRMLCDMFSCTVCNVCQTSLIDFVL